MQCLAGCLVTERSPCSLTVLFQTAAQDLSRCQDSARAKAAALHDCQQDLSSSRSAAQELASRLERAEQEHVAAMASATGDLSAARQLHADALDRWVPVC